jgi:ATP-dependent helicase HrpA
MLPGVLRLLLLVQQRNVRHLQRGLKNRDRLGLLYAPLGDPRELFDQLALVAARRAHLARAELPRDADAFARVLDTGRGRLAGAFDALAELTDRILDGAHGVRTDLAECSSPALRDTVDDVRAWLDRLVPPDFLLATPDEWLDEVPRYLEAARRRLAGLQGNVERDRERILELAGWEERLAKLDPVTGADDAEWVQLRWLLEEYRVSLFAQPLGTRVPVSPKRLRRRFEELEDRARLAAPE